MRKGEVVNYRFQDTDDSRMWLLITDQRILRSSAGRVDELSLAEVDSVQVLDIHLFEHVVYATRLSPCSRLGCRRVIIGSS